VAAGLPVEVDVLEALYQRYRSMIGIGLDVEADSDSMTRQQE